MNEQNTFEWFTARFQFVLFILAMLANILWSYFGIYKQAEMNSYRITQIEADRAKKWDNQMEITDNQMECINDIKVSLKEIQTDIKYIKNNN